MSIIKIEKSLRKIIETMDNKIWLKHANEDLYANIVAWFAIRDLKRIEVANKVEALIIEFIAAVRKMRPYKAMYERMVHTYELQYVQATIDEFEEFQKDGFRDLFLKYMAYGDDELFCILDRIDSVEKIVKNGLQDYLIRKGRQDRKIKVENRVDNFSKGMLTEIQNSEIDESTKDTLINELDRMRTEFKNEIFKK